MHIKMTLNADRPRIEPSGEHIILTMTDTKGSVVEISLDRSAGYCLEQDLRETRMDYGNRRVNPVIMDALRPWAV